MNSIRFRTNKCTDTINDEILVFVNGIMIEDKNKIELIDGTYSFRVQQFHLYDNKFFVLLAFFSIFDLFINAIDAGYLPRRWGRFAVADFELQVNNNLVVYVELQRERKNLFVDHYRICVESETSIDQDNYESRNSRTIVGTILFWSTILIGVVFLTTWIFMKLSGN